jgi:hypothetical protein
MPTNVAHLVGEWVGKCRPAIAFESVDFGDPLSEILVPDKFWPHLLMSNQYSMEQ